MNRIRNTCLCALTGLAVFCTAACTRGPAQAFEPTEDSLYITGSGQVTSAAIETYEKDYYTEEGLKAFVDKEKAPAALNTCTLADGTASLLIDFSSPAAYMEFMAAYPDEESGIQVESLDVVSVQDGVEKGYIVGSNFYKAGDEKTEVSAVDITKQKKFYEVCVTGSAKIQTDGAIQYVSEGVTLNGNTAETPKGETSYIIFR